MAVSQTVRGLSIGVAVAAVILGAGCGSAGGGRPPGAMPPPQVTVVTLKAQPVTLTRELPGRTSAFLVAEVRPQVSGIVKRRLFTEGGYVKAGQPLYELDDAIYRAQFNSARATLLKAAGDAGGGAARRPIAPPRWSRSMPSVRRTTTTRSPLCGQAEADVAAAQAAVDSSAVNLAYAHIVSPISGRIGKSSVTQGALVTADQTAPMATMQQLDPIYVDVNQSSSEWLQLKQEIDAGRVQAGAAGAPPRSCWRTASTYGPRRQAAVRRRHGGSDHRQFSVARDRAQSEPAC